MWIGKLNFRQGGLKYKASSCFMACDDSGLTGETKLKVLEESQLGLDTVLNSSVRACLIRRDGWHRAQNPVC